MQEMAIKEALSAHLVGGVRIFLAGGDRNFDPEGIVRPPLEVRFGLVIHDAYQVVSYLVVVDDLEKRLQDVSSVPPAQRFVLADHNSIGCGEGRTQDGGRVHGGRYTCKAT